MVQKLLSSSARAASSATSSIHRRREVVIRAGASQPIWSPSAANYPQNMIDPDGMWIASRLNYLRRRLQHAAGVGGRFAEDL
jgi:hypothetical protein